MPPKKSKTSAKKKAEASEVQEPIKTQKPAEDTDQEDFWPVPADFKIPRKLHLKNIVLNHINKGFKMRIKGWKCKSLERSLRNLSKYSEDASMWRFLEKCIPKNNKYFRKMYFVEKGYDCERRFWEKIYHKYKVPQLLLFAKAPSNKKIKLHNNIEFLSLTAGRGNALKLFSKNKALCHLKKFNIRGLPGNSPDQIGRAHV